MTGPALPAATVFEGTVCRICGAPLDAHRAARGGVCAAPACERQRVQEASRAVFQRSWNDFVDRQRQAIGLAAPQIARALGMLGARPDETAIGVVPHQSQPLAPLPEDRRVEFEAWLDEIVADAFAGPLPGAAPSPREREEAPEHPLIAATCATCQGTCCSLGGTQKAFLTVSDIQRFRRRHPEADAAAARTHYLGLLPERSVEHACVYQSATGCTLDRADRADICNRYHCNPQTQLLTRMREMKAQKAVIVAQEGETRAAVGAFDMRTGLERLRDASEASDNAGPEEVAAAREAALAQVPAPLSAPPAYEPPVRVPPPFASAAAARCEFCGAALDRLQAAAKCCGAPACDAARRRKLVRAMAESRLAELRARWRAVIAKAEDWHSTTGTAGHGAALKAALPYQDQPVEPPPAERRAAFEAHLGTIIAAAFDRPPEDLDLDYRAQGEPADPPVLAACCAACQGACCAEGGPAMAFLGETDIDRYRLRHPDAGPGEVRAAYLDRLPALSVRGACLFQAVDGCALPRGLRADYCNGFACPARDEVARLWAESGPQPLFLACHDAEAETPEPLALAVFDPQTGLRRLPGPPCPAGD